MTNQYLAFQFLSTFVIALGLSIIFNNLIPGYVFIGGDFIGKCLRSTL